MRIRFVALLIAVIVGATFAGCSEQSAANSGNGGDGGSDSGSDALGDGGGGDVGVDQGGNDTDLPDSVGPDTNRPDTTTEDTGDPVWPTCVPHPLGEERCGDGFDDDCDGLVDEGCGCTTAVGTQACYPGNPTELEAPATACQAGTQNCVLEFWDDCVGAIGPSEEQCGDEIDNDCDGSIDEDCQADPPVAECPADFDGPVLRDYTLNGGYSDPNGSALAVGFWSEVSAPPGHSRDLTSSGLDLTFFADVAGDYVFELTVENSEGLRDTCQTRFTALTDDLVRIEMFWNPDYTGTAPDTSDVDLLLRRNPTGSYQYYQNADTCYWNNCATCTEPYSVGDAVREQRCRDFLAGSPPAGYPEGDPWPAPRLSWTPGGIETDPRLDLDDVEGQGPENINIRRPNAGTYRVAVHYYDADSFSFDGSTNAEAYVRILCAGDEAYVSDGAVIRVRGQRSDYLSNDIWEVGDLVIAYDGDTPSCTFTPFGGPNCHRVCQLSTANSGGCPPADCE